MGVIMMMRFVGRRVVVGVVDWRVVNVRVVEEGCLV